jgi:predicted nucleotidyltransferase
MPVERKAPKLYFRWMPSNLPERQLADAVPNRAAARLRAFRREVEHNLPGEVVQMILFGSRARGDSHRDSDYDVAVFVKNLDDRRSIDHALADTAYRHILAGFHIRPVAVPADFLERPSRGALAMNIARDGIPIQ